MNHITQFEIYNEMNESEPGKSPVIIKQYPTNRIDLPDVRKEIESAIKKGDKVHMSLTKDRFTVSIDKSSSTRSQYNIKPIDAMALGLFDMFSK